MQGKYNRTKLKIHPVKGMEVDTPASKCLAHYIGVSLVICALALLLNVIRWW